VEANGTLLCAYHAWQFDGDGKCVSIPQSRTLEKEAALKASPKACVRSYPTQVAQGLIWCWGQMGLPGSDVSLQAVLKSPLLIEELSDPQYQGRITPYIWNQRDLPYGWDMFMEVSMTGVRDREHFVDL
jgi:phenylpropionate dioxygenase-like ring-hydroxylating dioxygenase large terminal subunit